MFKILMLLQLTPEGIFGQDTLLEVLEQRLQIQSFKTRIRFIELGLLHSSREVLQPITDSRSGCHLLRNCRQAVLQLIDC